MDVDITVRFEFNSPKYGRRVIESVEKGVRLNDDSVQVAAASLAYGLVEEAWSYHDEKEED